MNLKRLKLSILSIFICLQAIVFAQDSAQILKAGFIAKFAQFTNWPSVLKEQDVFSITVIGKDPIYSVLKTLFQKQKIKGCSVEVNNVHEVGKIDTPHILFISKAMASTLDEIVLYAQDKAIMTVSDTEKFGERGVLINFYLTDKGTLHFEINSRTMKRSPLKINLLLLEIAKVIR